MSSLCYLPSLWEWNFWSAHQRPSVYQINGSFTESVVMIISCYSKPVNQEKDAWGMNSEGLELRGDRYANWFVNSSIKSRFEKNSWSLIFIGFHLL